MESKFHNILIVKEFMVPGIESIQISLRVLNLSFKN